MRSSVAYFAGVGTVVGAIAAGLGGGLVIANIVSPHSTRADPGRQRAGRAGAVSGNAAFDRSGGGVGSNASDAGQAANRRRRSCPGRCANSHCAAGRTDRGDGTGGKAAGGFEIAKAGAGGTSRRT
jgi:hypothetical protein